MVTIFYKSDAQVFDTTNLEILQRLRTSDVLWIDMYDLEGEEKRAVEAFLGTKLQTRAQAEEIESSSRFSETDDAIFANTNFVIPGPDDYSMETVSFILCGGVLTTIREVPLRSFVDLQRRIIAFPKNYQSGYIVFTNIIEQRVDLDADMIEIMNKEIEQYSRKVNIGEDINEEEIKAYYKENVAFFKIPKYVWIMDEFPMTASGKIQKFVLRDMAVEKYSLQSDDSIETA